MSHHLLIRTFKELSHRDGADGAAVGTVAALGTAAALGVAATPVGWGVIALTGAAIGMTGLVKRLKNL